MLIDAHYIGTVEIIENSILGRHGNARFGHDFVESDISAPATYLESLQSRCLGNVLFRRLLRLRKARLEEIGG